MKIMNDLQEVADAMASEIGVAIHDFDGGAKLVAWDKVQDHHGDCLGKIYEREGLWFPQGYENTPGFEGGTRAEATITVLMWIWFGRSAKMKSLIETAQQISKENKEKA